MNFLYKFNGSLRRFEKVVAHEYTDETEAVSKEKAIVNLCARAKNYLGIPLKNRVELYGYLTIVYDPGVFEETYRVSSNYLTPENVVEYNAYINSQNKVRLPEDIEEKYGQKYGSLEEAKYFRYLEEQKSKPTRTSQVGWYINEYGKESKINDRDFDSFEEERHIEYNGDNYYYDKDEEVYWQEGHKYTVMIYQK